MPYEYDDLGLRIIGYNTPIRFYDPTRTLRAEIYLQPDNTLNVGGLTAGGSGSTSAGGTHGLGDLAIHTGTLNDAQAPQFLKADGTRPLTGNLTVNAGITIDGVDLSAHAADADAHHNQIHALAGSDHTASGLTAGYVIRASGATTFAWAQLQHTDLGAVTADQHHAGFIGLEDNAGTAVTPAADDRIQLLTGNTILGIVAGTNTLTLTVNQANIDHGGVAGLGDDDHPQYAGIAQAETITGTWTLGTTTPLQFRDAGLAIKSSVDGQLDIGADTLLALTSPTINVNASASVVIESAGVHDDVLVVDTAAGRVGINVAAPAAALELLGDIRASGTEIEVTAKAKHEIYLSDGAEPLFRRQTYYWTGTAWAATAGYGFGYAGLQNNTGAYANGFGHYTLYNNTGAYANGFGYVALQNNIGAYANGFGYKALQNNIGASANGLGHSALQNNIGAYANGFGYKALQYNQASDAIAIGDNAWSSFLTNSAGAKTFDYTAVDVATDRITITAHGFGATGAYVNLQYTQGTSAITGLTTGTIYQVKIIDANTIGFYEADGPGGANRGTNITAAGTGTGHILTPQYTYTGSVVIGHDTNPTKAYQVILGASDIVETVLRGAVLAGTSVTTPKIDTASGNLLLAPAADVSVSADIIPTTTDTYDLGSSVSLWRKGWLSELESILFVQNSVQVTGGWWMVPHASGTLAAAVAAADTTIDFGSAVAPNDFILLRGNLLVEYIQVGTLVSGTTYNVTRNLDGTGANDWPAGHVWVNLGYNGDGRIEFDAQTAGPRVSVFEQGTTYNAQTERVRIGDLATWGSAGLTGYGWAVGDYAGGQYAYYAPAGGLVVSGKITASEGLIGGWTILSTELHNTNLWLDAAAKQIAVGSQAFGADGIQLEYNAGNPRAYIGDGSTRYFKFDGTTVTWKAANTELDASGNLIASSATLSGTITATSGTIGGFTVNTTEGLYAGTGATRVQMKPGAGFWAGADAQASAPFSVTQAGALAATSATITGVITANTGYVGGTSGWVIAAGKLTSTGIGLATATGDATYAFWAGDNAPASAEFSVTHAGALKATNATITGTIDANAGHIGTLDIDGILTIASAGELRQGSGTVGTDFMGLRIWNDSGIGRIAGYNSASTSPQWYAGTDGKLYAGGGNVVLSSAGVRLTASAATTSRISWEKAYISGNVSGTTSYLQATSYNEADNGSAITQLEAHSITSGEFGVNNSALLYINVTDQIPSATVFEFKSDYGASSLVLARLNYVGDLAVDGGLYAGDYTGAVGPGQIIASDYIVATGGLRVGSASDPGTDNLDVAGTALIAGELRQGGVADQGAFGIQLAGALYAGDYGAFVGGLNLGGTTDPGDGNLVMTGVATIAGTTYIGDTANAKATLGLTINQGAADDEILALKSSDVAHGMTDDAETDTFGAIKKAQGTSGGLEIAGYKDADGINGHALALLGKLGEDADTTKSTSAYGVIVLNARIKSGTGVTDVGSDGNLVTIRNSSTTRFIFDAEGSAHADVEWKTYDDYDDVALLTDLERAMLAQRDPVKAQFVDFLRYNHAALEQAGIVHFDRDNPGHAMVNTTKLSMALVGAIRQTNARMDALEARMLTG